MDEVRVRVEVRVKVRARVRVRVRVRVTVWRKPSREPSANFERLVPKRSPQTQAAAPKPICVLFETDSISSG